MMEIEQLNNYNWAALKEEMKQQAKELGIDQIGVASADPFTELKQQLIRHRELGRESGFEEPDLDKRTNPALLFDAPQSIIAIAITYTSKLEDAPRSVEGARRGFIARSAWGMDYHHVLKDRLQKLEDWLREKVPALRIESMVDTGALSDRAVAERAGLGWSAKNCMIISPELGSWIFLGEMITNLPLPPDTPLTDQCGTCTKCLDACPTGALVGPGELDAQKCISFLTQTKRVVPEQYLRKMGNRLYGCDTCQLVCPVNRHKNWTHQPEFEPDPELAKPLLLPLLKLSNRQFKEQFGHTAAAWRGKNPIQRNAVIGLGNFKEAGAVPDLITILLEDPRHVLRATAAWSLGRIGGEAAKNALGQAAETEEHEEVLQAIASSLKKVDYTAEERRLDDKL
ncbi:tRNA epoxyqueuosine(34) reductase QueG [Paenibacillus yanchengensis]|uniref:Epoxyqueuosine reductase n=1 Tax=Paenibacillus yanchengensis TaxID=2035833 RepID=A0ABW4YI44_9BACL